MSDAYGEFTFARALIIKQMVNYPVLILKKLFMLDFWKIWLEANGALGNHCWASERATISLNGEILWDGKIADSLRPSCMLRLSDRQDLHCDASDILSNSTQNPIFHRKWRSSGIAIFRDVPNQQSAYTTRIGHLMSTDLVKTGKIDPQNGSMILVCTPTHSRLMLQARG